MKTKTVTFYCDLYPGWQDNPDPAVLLHKTVNSYKNEGWTRVRVEVELPCIGGSADVDINIGVKAEKETTE